MNIKKRGKNYLWTDEEKKLLENSCNVPANELSETKLQRTKGAINTKRSNWKYPYSNPPIYKRWEDWEDKILEENYKDKNQVLALLPHRSKHAITKRIYMLALREA